MLVVKVGQAVRVRWAMGMGHATSKRGRLGERGEPCNIKVGSEDAVGSKKRQAVRMRWAMGMVRIGQVA